MKAFFLAMLIVAGMYAVSWCFVNLFLFPFPAKDDDDVH